MRSVITVASMSRPPSSHGTSKRAIVAARNRAVAERDRGQRLTATDILRIRKTLGLTQAQAARVFGGGPNAFGKYESGEVAPSDGMEKLLRLADSVPAAAAWLLRRVGLAMELAVEPPYYRDKTRRSLHEHRRPSCHSGRYRNLRHSGIYRQATGRTIDRPVPDFQSPPSAARRNQARDIPKS